MSSADRLKERMDALRREAGEILDGHAEKSGVRHDSGVIEYSPLPKRFYELVDAADRLELEIARLEGDEETIGRDTPQAVWVTDSEAGDPTEFSFDEAMRAGDVRFDADLVRSVTERLFQTPGQDGRRKRQVGAGVGAA